MSECDLTGNQRENRLNCMHSIRIDLIRLRAIHDIGCFVQSRSCVDRTGWSWSDAKGMKLSDCVGVVHCYADRSNPHVHRGVVCLCGFTQQAIFARAMDCTGGSVSNFRSGDGASSDPSRTTSAAGTGDSAGSKPGPRAGRSLGSSTGSAGEETRTIPLRIEPS